MAAGTPSPDANPPPHFNVRKYVVNGYMPFPSSALDAVLARHTGTNVDLEEIVRAAADVQSEYVRQGYPTTGVGIAEEGITNGIVTMNVFQSAVPQIVVSGRSFLVSSNLSVLALNLPPVSPTTQPPPPLVSPTVTNAAGLFPPANLPAPTPASPEAMTRVRAALGREMADLTVKERDTRIHVICTNAGPRFEVEKYLVMGNSILPPEIIGKTLTNIDGAFGPNVCLDGIRTVVEQLQMAYHDRGYVTVAVGLPQQKLTNATVKVQVTEGRLAAIDVKGNRYFSSNNVMRSLPSLHTNIILNGLVFQSELNQANANQDRQIYPVIGPGPDPGTSALTLNVKDRLPLHAKVELDNQNSPGTPALRVNSSVAYNNLWQLEHSIGVQYGFSPEAYKEGQPWDFYDQPLVAYYSGFYRLPLGNPQSVENTISSNPNNFGYNEATHQFVLPPPSGQPELTLYASRSTIDPGVQTLSSSIIYDVPGVRQVSTEADQQDITINQALGFRLDKPLPEIVGIRSAVSGGMDFKTYALTAYETNTFSFLEITRRSDGSLNPPVVSSVSSPFPVTEKDLQYLPLTLHYAATAQGDLGTATLGLGISGNAWYSGSVTNVTGSTQSSGHWVTLDPSLSWNIPIHKDWILMINANGQWASEPLINTEQFSAGGVNSVRGYHEGEEFGDEGWRLSFEQETPPHVVGMVYGNVPLTVRGSVYMDYARILLIDPQGRPGAAALWGTGLGATASVGSHWEARLLFSVPLENGGTTEAYQPFFNFALTAQF